MPLYFVILILCFCFLPNITSTLRLPPHLSMYVLLFLALAAQILKRQKNPLFKWFAIYVVVLTVCRYSWGILSESIQSMVIFTLPAFIAMTMPDYNGYPTSRKYYHFLFYGVGIFFLVEIVFSLIEAIGHFYILYYVNNTYDTGNTVISRSVALAGASLTNSLIMSGLLAFILNSQLKNKIKYVLWAMGFLSLLCFQGRISIIVSFAYFAYYIFTHLKNNAKKNSVSFIFFILIVIAGVFALYMGLGGRLINQALVDDSSAGVRIRMFEYIIDSKLDNLMFGRSMKALQEMMAAMHVLIIECFAMIHVLLFGLVFTIVGYLLYGKLFKSFFVEYSIRAKLEIIVLYVGIAFINNSFAAGFFAMTYFLLFAKLFSPSIFQRVVPKKYLE